MLQIVESGMVFGEYKPEKVFIIENSQIHNQVGTGIKSVEFVLVKGRDKIFFVEAKSSSPKVETNWERYQEFLNEISDKFIHSFHMFCAWYMGRLNGAGEVGTEFSTVDYAAVNFIFVLVIRGHKMEWLLPLQEELNRKVRYHESIWKSRVIVMNDETAREYHLVA